MDGKYKTLLNNTKIFAIGNIVAKLSQYIIIALCTYRLSTAEFGISDTIIHTVAMLVPIFSADIASGLFRFSADKNYSKGQLISNAAVFNLAGSVIALIALPIEYLLLKSFQTAVFITLLTLFELYQASVKEYIRGLGLTKYYMISGFINAFTQIVSCILYIFVLNLGITGYILTIATGYAAEILYCVKKVRIHESIDFSFVSKPILKDLLKYGLPLAPNKIMWWIISASDRYFILWLVSASAAGLYGVAAKFPALITIVVNLFSHAWQISALQNYEGKDRDRFYSSVFNMLWAAIGLFTAAVIVFIKPAVKLFVSPDFFTSWEYAPFLLTAAAFNALQAFLGMNYTITKDSVGALKSTCVAAVCNLGLNYILISSLGVHGATIATLISFIIVTIYRYFDTRRHVKIVVDRKIAFAVTYLTLISECVLLSFFPNVYWITVIGFLIIVAANRSLCVFGFKHAKTILKVLVGKNMDR